MTTRQGPRRYECALNPALHGCETFDFAPADLPMLRRRLRGYDGFSVHAPLPTPPDYPGRASTSFLLDADPARRQASLDMLENTTRVAAEWGAQYVVVHYGGLHSDGLSPKEVNALADRAAEQLNAWANACDIHLHLEYSAYNPSFATPADLVSVVRRYASLQVCLDVGHLRIGAEMLGMDEREAAEMLAPYTRSMHLWTMRDREDVRRYHHVPVHPSLSPADGWIDIPEMLDLVLRCNPDCAIVFEPNEHYNPDRDWWAEGMEWVREIVDGYR
jgi:sugar phosphate isomerase/epimerase